MRSQKDILFVTLQGVIFLVYLLAGDKWIQVGTVGQLVSLALVCGGLVISVIALIQLNRNISPFPTPKEDGMLITTGIYRFIRHPIYTGIIMIALGFGFLDGSLIRVGLALLLWLFFHIKSIYEEKLLVEKYPDYALYQKSTGKLFPRVF